IFRELIGLSLVQMSDRLEVGSAVAVLGEEALVVLEAVRRSGHGVVLPIGVVILEHFPRPLLEVRRRDDSQVGLPGEADADLLPPRILGHQPIDRVAAPLREAGEDNLALVPGPVFGEDRANRVVPPVVAAGGLEHTRDILEDALDSQGLRDRPAQAGGLARGIGLRHEDAQDAVGSQRSGAQGGHDAAVVSSREPDDRAAETKLLSHLVSNGGFDLGARTGGVELQSLMGELGRAHEGTSPAAWRRSSRLLTFPLGVCGSDSRNSTSFGIMNVSRRPAQCLSTSWAETLAPARTTTIALTASPRTGSGMPTTAASATPGSEAMTVSTSFGLTFSPLVLMMSSLRLTK